ncbi:MAG: DUF4446 family protein [Candidatus Cryosericum sp.]|nr:DUF4446 family protein [bacterium]
MSGILAGVGSILGTVWAQFATLVLTLAAVFVGIVLLVQWKRQRARLGLIFGQAADPSFYAHIDTLTRAFDQQTAMEKELRAGFAELEQTSHGFFDTVDVEHYDAFAGQAGKFSFSLLMLNRHGTGMMLTSLTNAQGSKLYAKRIESGKSDTALSREEQELLSRHVHS